MFFILDSYARLAVFLSTYFCAKAVLKSIRLLNRLNFVIVHDLKINDSTENGVTGTEIAMCDKCYVFAILKL